MQRELKVGLLLTAILLAGLLNAQTILVDENSEVIFNMEADYWGEPVFEYSPDSVIWEEFDINLNEPFVVSEGMSGYYRLRMVDADCDSSYTSQVQAITASSSAATITNPTTGRIWMDRNLGASQVATSATDTAAYGDFYQWGRATTEFTIVTSAPYDWSVPSNNNYWQGVDGLNNPCPTGFRIPTENEWAAEVDSWVDFSENAPFNSSLKLTYTGGRKADGELQAVGISGIYWTSTYFGTTLANFVQMDSAPLISQKQRAYGAAVRCIMD